MLTAWLKVDKYQNNFSVFTRLPTFKTMPKIKILPILQSITIALIFFALGRLLVIRMGTLGIWISAILLIIFYALWWRNYQRDKKK
ncbi:MAG TPA: hypothetical protein DEH25_13270 [Chloroflexi bacterium]|nr:hypothetical protein [Chloroflexota bacterium]